MGLCICILSIFWIILTKTTTVKDNHFCAFCNRHLKLTNCNEQVGCSNSETGKLNQLKYWPLYKYEVLNEIYQFLDYLKTECFNKSTFPIQKKKGQVVC